MNVKKVTEIAKKISLYRQAYYAGKPLISDADYDMLEEKLRQLDPLHLLLQKIGTDIEQARQTQKVAHKVPMLSLQKTYLRTELLAWHKNCDLVGTLKIDGNSLSLVYQAGKLTMAKTRGNGMFGENVTSKARYIVHVAQEIAMTDKEVEIRGELYCSLSCFLRLAEEMEACGLAKPTSPRNVVAGLLGRNEYHQLAKYFSFFAYDILYPDVLTLESEQAKLALLVQLGFSVPEPRLLTNEQEIDTYLAFVKEKMAEDEIGIDGAVFAINVLAHAQTLGSTAHHPRSKMSFKWQGETAVAEILDIVWNVSRNGVVTPVAEVSPTTLSNALIQRVTLHNSQYVVLHSLKRGDKIKIVRSGEVIPKFLAVEEHATGEVVLPKQCPRCGSGLVNDSVRLLCLNSECPAQLFLAILHWIKCVEIKDLSEKRLAMLVEKGLVKSIPDLYRLQVEDMLKVPLTKIKMAEKLISNIQSSKQLPLEQFLHGLGIRGGGRATWRALVRSGHTTLASLQQLRAEDFLAIDGFADKSAEQLVEGLQAKRVLLADLLASGFVFSDKHSTGVLQGEKYVISGALSQPRAYFQKLIEQHGGEVSAAVSAKTTALITADAQANTKKINEAKRLGMKVFR